MSGKDTLKDVAEKEESLSRKKLAEDPGCPGMAWGAHSFAASRISSIREKDPASISDFGRYMAEKRRKLHVQFNEDSSNKLLSGATAAVAAQHLKEGQIVVAEYSTKSQLFKGISIWVDGFTVPSHQELRHLMLQYGGVFENYFRRDLVTHIICSTLPDSKIKDPRSLSRGLPIVRPEWVVDCIASKQVLPWPPYQLQRIALEHPNQRTIQSSYSAPRLDSGPLPLDWRDGSATDLEAIHDNLKAPLELLASQNELHSPSSMETSSGWAEIPMVQDLKEEMNNQEQEIKHHTAEMDRLQVPNFPSAEHVEMGDQECAAEHLETELREELGSEVEELCMGIDTRVNKKRSSVSLHDPRSHSTLGDKNFVQNYYKYSRLHFIGTWRNRYQSRYGSLGKPENIDVQELQSIKAISSGSPAIIHIDMDCFFVAVVIRERQDLTRKPVAVCHSDSARGTGEISSANYPARAFGIRAGMFVRDAKARCPGLEIVPYNFEAYEQVADQVYDILHRHCSRVQAVSCDEAFLDVTGQGDPIEIATNIRKDIFNATQCTASAGIAGNILLARLATRKAKPNGQYHIAPEEVEGFLETLAVEALPGVGWTIKDKLHSHDLRKCVDLRNVSKDFLQREFGLKTGGMLWSYARGIDIREVQPAQERKSIGAEVNWGVRFLIPEDAQRFLVTLSTEVATRLQTAATKGRTITLKVKRRKEGAGEPSKFMGCGVCDNLSRSESVAYATDSQEVLLRVARQLFNSFHLDVCEVRGVGLQVTRLEPVGPGLSLKGAKAGGQRQQRAIESWLAPQGNKEVLNEEILKVCKPGDETCFGSTGRTGLEEPAVVTEPVIKVPTLPSKSPLQDAKLSPSETQPRLEVHRPTKVKNVISSREHTRPVGKPSVGTIRKTMKPRHGPQTSLPAISDLDPSVLALLPPEILAEIQDVYGELPSHPIAGPSKTHAEMLHSPAPLSKGVQSGQSSKQGVNLGPTMEKTKSSSPKAEVPFVTQSEHGECSRLPPDNSEIRALPPASQLDPSVMAALPFAMRRELEQEYKRQEMEQHGRLLVPKLIKDEVPEAPQLVNTGLTSAPGHTVNGPQVLQDGDKLMPLKDLWLGSPPKWVGLFQKLKVVDYSALCFLGEQMSSNLTLVPFSTILVSLLPHLSENSYGPINETVIQSCVELVKQYCNLVVHRDLEEVSMVMRVLKRASTKSQLWKVVEDITIPSIQAIVGECYGGHLQYEL